MVEVFCPMNGPPAGISEAAAGFYGVGGKKAADFGDAFLDAMRTFRRPE